jgi:SNF2 family DNA or RNA helicase
MGLGKTLMGLALILTTLKYREKGKGGTLIVLPVTIMQQWR